MEQQQLHEQSKVARSQYSLEGLFYSIILSVRPAEWTPLPSLSDKTSFVDCCIPSTQNRMNCGWVIPLFAVRWGHHKSSLLLSMAFSDSNAHQRDSQRCLPHNWSQRQRQWERCGQCVGAKHRRCCWLRWWMWRSQRWCELGRFWKSSRTRFLRLWRQQ
jgi:hypothetical protein